MRDRNQETETHGCYIDSNSILFFFYSKLNRELREGNESIKDLDSGILDLRLRK